MIDATLKGLVLGFFLALSIGPVIFTVIKQSVNNGRKGGFSFIAGVWISDIVLVIISNIFSAWVTEMLQFRQVIGFTGSVFLILMGSYYVLFKKVQHNEELEGRNFKRSDVARAAVSGFLINTLNPSVILFWLLNATAFAATHTPKQRVTVFSVCLLVNISADVGKVLMAGKLSKRLTIRNMTLINCVSGTILVCFGLALMYGAIFLADEIPSTL